VIEALGIPQVEVIAIDLPGHGESIAPPVDYTAGYFTDAVEGLLEHLDLQKAVLVGESIGASISLILAPRGNPRIAHVVAVHPHDYGRWGGARRHAPPPGGRRRSHRRGVQGLSQQGRIRRHGERRRALG
jgi:pimeloyl-ACP methyl ester carboxylesterase